MIGGAYVRYTGQTYSGAQDQNDSDDIETAIFHGTFKGTADKAIHSSKANSSVLALAASTAVGAVGTSAQAAAFISAASTITGVLAINDLMATFTQETEQGHVTVEPNTITDIFD